MERKEDNIEKGKGSRPKGSRQQNQPSSDDQQQHPGTSTGIPEFRKRIHDKRLSRLARTRLTLFASNMALSYINVGTSIAWVAPLIYDAVKAGFLGLELKRIELMLIGTLMFMSMVLTPVLVGALCNTVGRKLFLVLASVISCVSWFCVIFVSAIEMVYAARLLAGVWAGVVLTIVPSYVAEMVPEKPRRLVYAINNIMLMFGFELTFVLGPNVELTVMAIVCSVVPHVFLCLMIYLPESAPWLIHKNKIDQARTSFEWMKGKSITENPEVMQEFMEMSKSVYDDFPVRGNFRLLYSTKANQRALMIVVSLTALQRLSGITALTAYVTVTIPDAPIGHLTPPDVITVLGMVWIISTVLGIILIAMIGRVKLLITSCIGCAVANTTCAAWFYVNLDNIKAPYTLSAHWFPFIGIMVYGFFFIVGLGSIPNVLVYDMFNTANKFYASAITVIVMSFFSGIANVIYFPIAKRLGMHVNFVIFSVACIIALLFALTVVPETKGKPLHVIQAELG